MKETAKLSSIVSILLSYFFLIGCGDDAKSQKVENKISDSVSVFPITLSDSAKKSFNNGSVNDILILKDRKLRESLFRQIKTWYRDHGDTTDAFLSDRIFPPLTESLLNNFIQNINVKELEEKGELKKEYNLGILPKEYRETKNCLDGLALYYDQEVNSFSLALFNNFYIEEFGCSEHETIYSFRISIGTILLT